MEWFYSGLAGIRAGENAVAFNEIVIRPEPVGDVTSARASYHCPYGLIRSEWKKNNGSFQLTVEVPANTTATVYLPAAAGSKVLEGGAPVKEGKNLQLGGYQDGRVPVKVRSGEYRFVVQ